MLLPIFSCAELCKALRKQSHSRSVHPGLLLDSVPLCSQTVSSNNRIQGWQKAIPICNGTNQAVTSVPAECDPSNQIYRSAARNLWTGVICNSAGYVTCLHLAGLGLHGSAASLSLLGGLPSLGYLNLQGNRLHGEGFAAWIISN